MLIIRIETIALKKAWHFKGNHISISVGFAILNIYLLIKVPRYEQGKWGVGSGHGSTRKVQWNLRGYQCNTHGRYHGISKGTLLVSAILTTHCRDLWSEAIPVPSC